eukprot:m.94754 g.94754  ORF g.94754 m.94754 type:complete len:517 (-) comp8581_c0_seq3:108-1658(-)
MLAYRPFVPFLRAAAIASPARRSFLTDRASAPERVAIVSHNVSYTYGRLLEDSASLAHTLCQHEKVSDLAGHRVAFLAPPTYDWAAMHWAIWRAGGVSVPLSPHHTPAELEYFIKDSQSSVVLAHPKHAAGLASLGLDVPILTFAPSQGLPSGPPAEALPTVEPDRDAMIIYTSGTTGKPKGVVTSHKNVLSQVRTLYAAWEWTQDDVIYNVLPLHHIHGIVNVVLCGLYAGARVDMADGFHAQATLDRLRAGDLTLFMAVPTVYARLLAAIRELPTSEQSALREAMSRLRLMVSGSAALPRPVMEAWEKASGHVLLERYGMTEIGMALSNPLHGPRLPGRVGQPLPGVLVHIEGGTTEGELLVGGPSVFKRYWNRPDATREAFGQGGMFRTGDIVAYDREANSYTILGRASVDIIKSGGYKLSALEIEPAVLSHPAVSGCAVVGLPDLSWGERVTAVVTLHPGQTLTLDALREHCKAELASYKLPSVLKILDAIPRNAMGKVNKKELVKFLLRDV